MKLQAKFILIGMTSALLMASNAMSAGYIKFEGIDGESKRSESQETSKVKKAEAAKPAGLLLPAVQPAREAGRSSSAPKPTAKGGNAETTWKVEKGEK